MTSDRTQGIGQEGRGGLLRAGIRPAVPFPEEQRVASGEKNCRTGSSIIKFCVGACDALRTIVCISLVTTVRKIVT